ncbi:dihydroorotase [Gloeomargarita lithophora Alchichica-D10]|uniref:Dihydroorotase n=1 Tax=Gloeomargarita lithophora Alchichica-D10 TaxID=1188229 RepID=A0A1J0AAK8_9CYAN|nr:dihydroorotase [Gloeomargarita lithophora]APB32966.1 dihydroorotase [Gloeomargarita lithophora Alchichica-D10]
MATNPPPTPGFGLPAGVLNPGHNLILRQVRLLDPVGQRDEITDVWLEDGVIAAIDTDLPTQDGVPEYPAQECILGPGLVDLYSQSSEPGHEGRETLAQLTNQAVQGGFTRLTLLPGTQPVLDHRAGLAWWHQQQAAIPIQLHLWGALTQGLGGEQMAELAELAQAGVAGFSDGQPLADLGLLQQLLTYARPLGKPVALCPCDPSFSPMGVARPGTASLTLGLPEIPPAAETTALTGILELVNAIGTPVHLMRISTRRSVMLLTQAKAAGLPITASTTWAHLLWDSTHLGDYNPYLRFDPPLGNPEDRFALIQGVKTGVIDAIAIDHHAHTYEEKTVPFALAPPRLAGLAGAFSYLWAGLVTPGQLTPGELWQALSTKALSCLGLKPTPITPGQATALTLFAPQDTPINKLPLPGAAQGQVRWVLVNPRNFLTKP